METSPESVKRVCCRQSRFGFETEGKEMAGMIFCIAFFLAAFPFLERTEPYMRVRFAEQFLVIIEFQTYPGGGSGSESTESNSWSLDWRPSTALRAGLRGKDG